MALADTGKAIGKVTKLLTEHLNARTGLVITAGRPEPPTGTSPGARRLNLFLYEALFDPSLKNVPLDEGQQPPLWLVLKYLMTAFDADGNSDTIAAHEDLGEGLRALQELSFLPLTNASADIMQVLGENPEPLKITFDEASSELLSKLMQGTDEKYRFSISFQVRPVMIVTGVPPSYSLLVGVDYTQQPPAIIGEDGVVISVLPSLGPKISHVVPATFEVNSTLTIFGSDLHLANLTVHLGAADVTVISRWPDRIECQVNGNVANGNVISAGSLPISVVQNLPTGRKRSSNILVGELLPTLDTAVLNAVTRVNPADPNSAVFGNIDMTGFLLGTATDDVFVALFRVSDRRVVKVFDAVTTHASQTQLGLVITEADAVPAGTYRIILRVNGQQAKRSPEVDLRVP